MIPYLTLSDTYLELIVESNMIDTCRSGRELKQINLEDKKNLLLSDKNNVRFAVEHHEEIRC